MFMLAWLSATNTASLPEDLAPNISVIKRSAEDNIVPLIDSKDALGETLASGNETKAVAKSSQ
jgi:hypothetical protein